jgi:cellulose synthase/poly-beta-1,6-N-acetylglucosamine synthase-like glycosyltransferase
MALKLKNGCQEEYNMKLDILIPQYKEPDKLVKRLLDSIAIQ